MRKENELEFSTLTRLRVGVRVTSDQRESPLSLIHSYFPITSSRFFLLGGFADANRVTTNHKRRLCIGRHPWAPTGSSLLKRGPGPLANGRGSRRLWSLDRDTSAPRRVPDRTAGRHVLASWRIPVFLRRICRRVPLICTILTLHDDVVRILSLDPSKEHVSGLQIAKSFPSDDVIQCRSGRTGAALAMGIPMPCLGRDPQREKWVCSLIFSSRG